VAGERAGLLVEMVTMRGLTVVGMPAPPRTARAIGRGPRWCLVGRYAR